MLAFALIMGTAVVPAAGPVYLTCDFPKSDVPWAVDFAVDERGQQVTIGRPNGAPVTVPALFDPAKIVVGERAGAETITWTISRVDLSVQMAVSFSPRTSTGMCNLKPAPAKRAF